MDRQTIAVIPLICFVARVNKTELYTMGGGVPVSHGYYINSDQITCALHVYQCYLSKQLSL